MDKQRVEWLIRRHMDGEATPEEQAELEELIASGDLTLADVPDLDQLHSEIIRMEDAAPSRRLDDQIYAMLANKKKENRPRSIRGIFSWPERMPRLALASLTLVLGIAAGYVLRTPSADADRKIDVLSQQVSDLQEMMMLSLLEKGSATERLKAVNLTQEMSDASRKVTNALLQTLNHDENVNVRLAALEALKPYAAESGVREALIRSIARQESPLVQISMAELMVALQEKSAVKEFQKIVDSDKTPAEVKKKIKESIDILI
jgi:hypothetical protein